MACYRLWALWLLCLLKGPEASRGDPAPMQVIGTLGKSVTLHLEIPRGEELEDLTWSKEGTIAIVTPGEPIKVIDKKIRDRVEVMSNNYSLQINSLTLEDAGVYRAQINIKDSDMTTTKEYNLQVYEQLTEPQVRMNSTVLKDGHCIIFLICSVNARRNDVTYSWSPLGPNAAVSNGGSVIQISWKPCNADWNYTCTAKNPVSFSTFQVTPSWDLCPGPGTSEGNLTPTIVIGTLGDLITFPLEIPSGVESIVWISNTSLTKTEPGEVGKLKRVKTQRPDRIRDPARDFSLQIPNVQMENQGLYIAHVCTNSSSIPTTHWFSLQVYKSKKNRKAWLALLGLLGLPVPCWYVWKKKRRGHCFDCCRTQTQSRTPEELPEYKKLELVFEGSSRREGSVNSDTTLEDNMVHKPICESTVKHGPMPDEGDAYDAVCGEEEIYDPVTPEEISYVQISQEETPNPQKFQSSETIYCVVKKPQTVGSLKSDTESPEASLYENLT